MDPFSHYMFAWLVGRRLGITNSYLKLVLIVSLLPDFDVVSIIFGLEFVQEFHGTLTHSVFVALLLGTIVTVALSRVLRLEIFRSFRYGILAVGSHLLLDIFNLGLYGYKGRFLFPIYSGSLFLRHLLAIPLQFSLTIYVTIMLLMFSILLFSLKSEPPWAIWFKR